jgi:hypothetical protein
LFTQWVKPSRAPASEFLAVSPCRNVGHTEKRFEPWVGVDYFGLSGQKPCLAKFGCGLEITGIRQTVVAGVKDEKLTFKFGLKLAHEEREARRPGEARVSVLWVNFELNDDVKAVMLWGNDV